MTLRISVLNASAQPTCMSYPSPGSRPGQAKGVQFSYPAVSSEFFEKCLTRGFLMGSAARQLPNAAFSSSLLVNRSALVSLINILQSWNKKGWRETCRRILVCWVHSDLSPQFLETCICFVSMNSLRHSSTPVATPSSSESLKSPMFSMEVTIRPSSASLALLKFWRGERLASPARPEPSESQACGVYLGLEVEKPSRLFLRRHLPANGKEQMM